MFRLNSILTCLISTCLLVACSSTQRIDHQNLVENFLNKQQQSKCAIDAILNEDSLFLFVKINHDKFYGPQDRQMWLKLKYEVFPDYSQKQIIDSASHVFLYENDKHDVISYETLQFKRNFNLPAVLKITIADQLSSQSFFSIVDWTSKYAHEKSSFILVDTISHPLFRNFVATQEKFLYVTKDSSLKNFNIIKYNSHFPIAKPPFSVANGAALKLTVDTNFIFEKNQFITIDEVGVYSIHFQNNSNIYPFTVHLSDFPFYTSVEPLIESIRYITTQTEYQNLINSKDKKLALDNFWITVAGSQLNAKRLIRCYYDRVYDANLFFTSYLDGWKTDRGMIYTIFGKPISIYRDQYIEQWTYRSFTSLNQPDFTFVFKKMLNPVSDNDYQLERQSYYDFNWYQAVESWRHGRIVNY